MGGLRSVFFCGYHERATTMKVLKILALCLVVFVLGSIAIGLGSLGNTVAKGDDKAAAFAAVSDQITLGMNEQTVRALAGRPEDKSRDQYKSYDGSIDTTDYWYYGVLSTDGWQLVFENNKLRSINRG